MKRSKKLVKPIVEITFADVLKEHAEKMGVRKVAEACGVSTRSIYLWIQGGGKPSHCVQVGCTEILKNL